MRSQPLVQAYMARLSGHIQESLHKEKFCLKTTLYHEPLEVSSSEEESSEDEADPDPEVTEAQCSGKPNRLYEACTA